MSRDIKEISQGFFSQNALIPVYPHYPCQFLNFHFRGKKMLYEELTGKILQACFEVSKELGIGYLESVYEESLLVALQQKGLRAENQIPLKVKFRGVEVGDFYVDVLVEGKILIELKTAQNLTNAHYAQTINYLKATGIEVGLLINFGNPKIEYRRFNNRFLESSKIDIKDILAE